VTAALTPPSDRYRALVAPPVDCPLPKGIDAAWDRMAGALARRRSRTTVFMARACRAVALAPDIEKLSSSRLTEALGLVRERFRRACECEEDVVRAAALVREAAFRELGQRPFVEQIAGGLAMASGCCVEMATGEGKTLAAVLPAVFFAWRGAGCHVVTVNDYLAQRDATWMAPVYKRCHVRCAWVTQEIDADARRKAYAADVTYLTNKEAAADFLRDRIALGRATRLHHALLAALATGATQRAPALLMRGLASAIIDEADSILIDEAVTPLIISSDAPNDERDAAYVEAAALAHELDASTDYVADAHHREVRLTKEGRSRFNMLRTGKNGVWTGARRSEELVVQALRALAFHRKGEQYVLQDGKIVIVDEFTGRLMADRSWRDGVHQAVEAQEGVAVTPMKDTHARISFQRFFRLYPRLAGMTGTAWESRRELWQVYRMPLVRVPTHKPCARAVAPDRVFPASEDRWREVVRMAREAHHEGRPALLGVRSVSASKTLSERLSEAGVPHNVLNAERHAQEARIVAEAGSPGRITVATNMAGRGTDIRLGAGVAEKGGLLVIATERHEAPRIDRQLFGRCARQGDPGQACAVISADDELFQRFLGRLRRWLLARAAKPNGKAGFVVALLLHRGQRKAQRTALQQRKAVLRMDEWLDEQLGFADRDV